jgi:septum formation protein
MSLVLASGSPRRADLLRSAGVQFRVLPVTCDETPSEREVPTEYCTRIAQAKADAAAQDEPDAVVLAADTIVWTSDDRPPMGKPIDRGQARDQLRTLMAGRSHFVTTAFVLRDGTHEPPRVHADRITSRVWMRNLGDDELDALLDEGHWSDKAGGYGIQCDAAALVTRIKGSYTNVVGLPLAQVLDAFERLRSFGDDG